MEVSTNLTLVYSSSWWSHLGNVGHNAMSFCIFVSNSYLILFEFADGSLEFRKMMTSSSSSSSPSTAPAFPPSLLGLKDHMTGFDQLSNVLAPDHRLGLYPGVNRCHPLHDSVDIILPCRVGIALLRGGFGFGRHFGGPTEDHRHRDTGSGGLAGDSPQKLGKQEQRRAGTSLTNCL